MARTPAPSNRREPDRARLGTLWGYPSSETDHRRADQDVADDTIMFRPDLPMIAQANSRFVSLAAWYLMVNLGIRQFLNVEYAGPRSVNLDLHNVVQDIDPTARVLYVANEPSVDGDHNAQLAGAGTPTGRVEYLLADATDPGALLNHPTMASTLDVYRPVALMLVSVLAHLPDAVAHHVVSTLLAGLPAGSCVVISHLTADFNPEAVVKAAAAAQRGGITYIPRTRGQITRFFTGLDLIEPGVVPLLTWESATHPAGRAAIDSAVDAGEQRYRTLDAMSVDYWAGIGRRRSLAPPANS